MRNCRPVRKFRHFAELEAGSPHVEGPSGPHPTPDGSTDLGSCDVDLNIVGSGAVGHACNRPACGFLRIVRAAFVKKVGGKIKPVGR